MATQKLKDINTIVIHCSATKEDVDYPVEQLLRDHKARGFTTCGYHVYIRKDGSRYNGRPFTMVGAHAGAGHNTNSIGICYEGGLSAKSVITKTVRKEIPKDTRTEEQKITMLDAIFDVLRAVKEAGGNVKAIRIIGHRDLSPDLNGNGIVEPSEWIKSCPCFEAKEEFQDIVKTF